MVLIESNYTVGLRHLRIWGISHTRHFDGPSFEKDLLDLALEEGISREKAVAQIREAALIGNTKAYHDALDSIKLVDPLYMPYCINQARVDGELAGFPEELITEGIEGAQLERGTR